MKCEKCNSKNKQIKAGKIRAGSQMYKCKNLWKSSWKNIGHKQKYVFILDKKIRKEIKPKANARAKVPKVN